MPRPRKRGMELMPPGIYLIDGQYVRRVKQADGRFRKVPVAPGSLDPDAASAFVDAAVQEKDRTVGWLMREYVRSQPKRLQIIHVEFMREAYNLRGSNQPLGRERLSGCTLQTMVQALDKYRPISKLRRAVVLMTWLGKVFDMAKQRGIKHARSNYPRRALKAAPWANKV